MPLDLPLPEHCSLLQAALWVARGQRPVPDEIFEAARLRLDFGETESDGPLRPLLLALRSGAIPARAIWVLETAPHSDDIDWKPEERHVSPWMSLPLRSWAGSVFWEQSRIVVDISFIDDVYSEIPKTDLEIFDAIRRASREVEPGEYQQLSLCSVQIGTVKLLSVFPGPPGMQPYFTSTEAPHAQNYTPPYLAFMLQACQQLGLSADRRVTKQEIEAWIRKNWPRALGQPSNSKVEYMSTFLRHPEDEKGGHYRPMRKT